MAAVLNGMPLGAGGAIFVAGATTPISHYFNGFPISATGAININGLVSATASYTQGLGVDAAGKLLILVENVLTPDYYGSGAAPFTTASNGLMVSTNPVDHYANGVPYTANGAVAVTTTPA
jgi:hypothetical protein